MKKVLKNIFLFILSASLIFLANCQNQLPNIVNIDKAKGEEIIALGDSITVGYGLPSEQAYPDILSKKIGIPIVNKGVSGDTTETALNRLENDVLTENPWIVIVGLGGNDALRKVPLTETESNLREIITQIQGEGAIVVLLGMNVAIYMQGFKELYQTLAQDTGSYLIPDVLKGVLDNPNNRQSDLIHPNAKGQEILADNIYQGIKPLLAKIK